MRRLLAVVVLALLAAAPAAHAVVPETAVGGAGSKWFSGSLIQQPGSNCSVLGSPTSEIMVSAIGSYGGTGGVVKVGDQYWTSLLVSVPGNPCGVGSSGISTDLILPKGTAIDGGRPIRCFYLPRGANTNAFQEVTGQTWSAFGSSGPICPSSPSPSAYHAGAYNIGYRPLASGGMLEIFVPVTTNTTLNGMGGPDKFSWLTDATGVYANPGLSEVWANVFAGQAGDQPFVYFARTPSAISFWKADAPTTPSDLRNRTEFFANFYVAGKAGAVSFEIRRTDTNALVIDSSNPAAAFNGTVGAGQSLIQLNPAADARGPNGGYAPFAWDPPGEWGVPMTITWKFTPQGGSAVTGAQSFRTLPGPDADGDGVADSADACPAVAGTLANGCLPAVEPDPDGDGVFGTADACPNAAGPGRIDGCPVGGGGDGSGSTPLPPSGPPPTPAPAPGTTTVTPAPAAPQLVATLGAVKRNARLTYAALKRGVKVKVTCSATARATLVLARGGSTLAKATGTCKRSLTLTLKPSAKTLAKLKRLKKPASATLKASLSATGAQAGSATVAVRVG
ncbi:thrombospondin type 3 repeat-containing protein [Baekduia sp. Peel2402]|uniref:thrombospondin type 3 repeat-containing protein n=1 Tax=Baekduia sp. Peel2402 TaxID=3458296 RepID=UPI00403E7E44